MPAEPPAPPPPVRDVVYAAERRQIDAFRFDATVADAFADMITRSVPGYAVTLEMLGVIARRFARSATHCYDLGCSLGASTLAIRHHVPHDCMVIGVDNSPEMVARARAAVAADTAAPGVEIRCEDVRTAAMQNASVVALNFTLQFIPPPERAALLARVAAGLHPEGCLVLSEKIGFADPVEQELLGTLHIGFKQSQGYSALEISQKRAALENVLVPETLAMHRERLIDAGFRRVTVWFQCLNFVSLLARK